VITHIVALTLTDPDDSYECVDRLQALVPRIAEIDSLAAGVDIVESNTSAHVGLVTTHADLGALKAYQAHAAHQDFLAWLGPRLAARTVVDFES